MMMGNLAYLSALNMILARLYFLYQIHRFSPLQDSPMENFTIPDILHLENH